jgi:ADP-ribosylglycohydrolase
MVPAYGRLGAVTDDTQMTMFTADGLMRAETRGLARGIVHIPSIVCSSYMRWLATQGEPVPAPWSDSLRGGWLVRVDALYSRRAPGNTCLSALRGVQDGRFGTLTNPPNNSKGCGAVMRVAPVGLRFEPTRAFALGCETAVITHGHPTGWLAAGAFAEVVSHVARGEGLRAATAAVLDRLRDHEYGAETAMALDHARRAADELDGRPGTAADISALGAGWVAEEALAIAAFSALTTSRKKPWCWPRCMTATATAQRRWRASSWAPFLEPPPSLHTGCRSWSSGRR